MAKKVEDLANEIRGMLSDSGFPEEDYIVTTIDFKVKVLFDTKGAVDYFRGDFDYSYLCKDHVFRYEKDGKRHCAIIF